MPSLPRETKSNLGAGNERRVAVNEELLAPEEHVLSTLESDGSRRWLKPRLSKGGLLERRRAVAYGLIALYTVLPLVHVGGEPIMLFDLGARRFTIFGLTFLPTDTLLLALLMVGGLLGFFLLTALFGRVWCGWACPHTVYMEFVFRPIERLFEGTRGRGGKPRRRPSSAATAARHGVYLLISFILANTFLAYFIGVGELGRWMTQSPLGHPTPFLIMGGLTAAMMFHFSFFREQLCILACPYGRLQSGLLDEDSLIVSYDARRGEPRGRRKRLPIAKETAVGDCVDCKLCVTTCPTGIDIREGLQMECVNCTQCIDACDAVMHKLGRPPRLIRFSSKRADQGAVRRLLRARTAVYPLIIAAVGAAFVVLLAGKQPLDAVVLRSGGQPFVVTDDGRVRNQLKLKLTNRGTRAQRYGLRIPDPQLAARLDLELPRELELEPGSTDVFPLAVFIEPGVLDQGRAELSLEVVVDGDPDARVEVDCTLLGPAIAQPRGAM